MAFYGLVTIDNFSNKHVLWDKLQINDYIYLLESLDTDNRLLYYKA